MKNDLLVQNITQDQIEFQVQDQLLRLLESIPVISNIDVYSKRNGCYDIEAHADLGYLEKLNILCEVKLRAEPQYVRKAAIQLIEERQRLKQETDREFYCLIAAPYISRISSKICEEMGIGYIDLSGNCMFKYKSLYIRLEGKPNRYSESRGSKSIFERSSVKSSIILRHLIKCPEKIWKMQEVADATSTSIGLVAKVKKFLEEREFIINQNNGFSIAKPREILAEWAKVYNAKQNNVYECYSIDTIPQIEQKLIIMRDKQGIECLLTGFAGGVRYSPTVRYNKIHVYVQMQDLQEVMTILECKRVTSGANISIIVPYDPCVLIDARKIKNSFVASPIQVYLDLMGLKGRGEEAAVAILEKEIV